TLRQADAGDRRMAEHRAGDAIVAYRGGIIAEHGIGESLPFADRDGRQLHPIGHVADRVDAFDVGPRVLVDLYLPALAQFDPRTLQPKPFGVRDAARGEHHAIDI